MGILRLLARIGGAAIVAAGGVLALAGGSNTASAVSARVDSAPVDNARVDDTQAGAVQTATAAVRHGLQSTEALRHRAKIVLTRRSLQCVPYARKISGIQIRGDAWTWWKKAKGRYGRGRTPEVGAVLVMKKTRRLRWGHLAVVKEIVNSRTIVVDQANWLNRGRIHLNTAVLDVSRNNDWSAVRVWYTPGGRLGSGTYSVQGFIYGEGTELRQASLESLPLPRRRPDRRLAGQGVTDITSSPQLRFVPQRKVSKKPKAPATSVVNHILRMREGA